jgi:hypothetical protein
VETGYEPESSENRDTEHALDTEKIAETSKESIGKLHSLLDDLKTVEEHEKGILGE